MPHIKKWTDSIENLMIEREPVEPVRLIDALALELIIYKELTLPKALRVPVGAHYKLQ